jgi:3-hydroxyisobutyrate dehydrogenase
MLAPVEALGVDPDSFRDLIKGGPSDMGYLHAKTDLTRQGKLSPASFAVETAEKDARLALTVAGQPVNRRCGMSVRTADHPPGSRRARRVVRQSGTGRRSGRSQRVGRLDGREYA